MHPNIARPLLAATTLCLTAAMLSCSDDEEAVVRGELLTGEWTLADQEVSNIVVSGSVAGIPISGPIDNFLSDEQKAILDTVAIFPPNGTLTFNADQTYTLDEPSLAQPLVGTWTLNGNILTITGLDQASQFLESNALDFTVLSLTESRLSMSTSVPNISLADLPVPDEVRNATVSADYQLDLQK